ncbi:MAG: hypothetical protein IBJ00_05575 [Alphaproteobacteria bacterium]|nr:hypothetical protein [Alphaproteobacteria bacterium]
MKMPGIIMTIESRVNLISTLRCVTNLLSFIAGIAFMIWYSLIINVSHAELVLISVPAYALVSTFFDWLLSKLAARLLKEADSHLMLEQQELTIGAYKSYLDLILKFRLMRIVIGGLLALIAFIFSFYPLFTFALVYLASFIASLCYFSVMNIKIPRDMQLEPSRSRAFSKSRIENNSAIIGTAAHSMRRYR